MGEENGKESPSYPLREKMRSDVAIKQTFCDARVTRMTLSRWEGVRKMYETSEKMRINEKRTFCTHRGLMTGKESENPMRVD